ncbi:NupC/NupG family nucleoside CNT transporter [Vibrio europaeus]|uniref:NupC/NupG family nucleoside CNT transporter n=1 Tax=Vibrio europaeus TaxID=300876 RepID=UPI00233E5B6E|nr:NupC/NupG family nucleoside CNT transporter [Vibrio europaeus]MDC5841882.1 NupC/NupG family nucleoside CNT transporter [Vibrio europaeus]MDC5856335.1 NupC/NupG family nucleoside CNT transporter [Vibrio europaeus]
MQILSSLLGMIVLLGIAYAFSMNRKLINLRTVFGAFSIQFLIGAFVLFVPIGKDLLQHVSNGINAVLGYSADGIGFLFGGLASDQMFELFGGGGFVFAIRVLPVIVFFSALVSVLYYFGVMQVFIRILGGGLQKLLGTSKYESMSATANIFVGQTEAPLVIAPYIKKLSRSELFAVMCGGLASIAGTVLGGFAAMGVNMEYLIAASFMAAPGGLLFAKILLPETKTLQEPESGDDNNETTEEQKLHKPSNVIDAAAEGASNGVALAINVGGMLLAFIALIALLNGVLGLIGGFLGMPELSLELILGYLFSPLAVIIGIPFDEAFNAATFIGQKLVLNEFVAYVNFTEFLADTPLSERTTAIITFALCGFANFSAAAMLLGGLGSMAKERRSEISSLCLYAILAGTLSNLMSATIAGLFLSF